jgi:hypothetical protein
MNLSLKRNLMVKMIQMVKLEVQVMVKVKMMMIKTKHSLSSKRRRERRMSSNSTAEFLSLQAIETSIKMSLIPFTTMDSSITVDL